MTRVKCLTLNEKQVVKSNKNLSLRCKNLQLMRKSI